MGGRTRVAPLPRLAAACTAVMAWTLAAGSARMDAPTPYATLALGSVVLASFVAAVEIRRTNRFEARLAAMLLATLVVVAQSVVATVGTPATAGGHWSVAAAIVVAYGCWVPVLIVLDARTRAARLAREAHLYAR